jgi:hypothetical protein
MASKRRIVPRVGLGHESHRRGGCTPRARSSMVVANSGYDVVGAGVSTCAPIVTG